jgi:Lrp/AsnC family transcriptional regulator for asnA, asnC and gidA
MKIDRLDEEIMSAFQQDGRQSNREVARLLDVSEGTIRQRLGKLQKAGAIRFDVVTDPEPLGINFVAYVRASVAPRHLEGFLQACEQMTDLWYVAAMAGRFNVQAVICTGNIENAMKLINDSIETLPGVNEVLIRPAGRTFKQDIYEIVIPRRA